MSTLQTTSHVFLEKLRAQWRSKLLCMGLFMAVPVYLEGLLHLFVFGGFGGRIGYPILFALICGSVLYFISSLFPRKANRIVGFCLICLLVVYFEVQLVYHGIFGTFMPIAQVALGADAVTNFSEQVLHGIWQNIIPFLLLLLPVPAAAFLFFRNRLKTERLSLPQALASVLLTVLLSLGTMGILHLCDNSPASALQILNNPNASTEACVKNVGLTATTVQEISALLFGKAEANFSIGALDGSAENLSDGTEGYNCTDIDFQALMDKTTDSRLIELDQYFSYISPTPKNEYTGLTEGYNLIMLCAESFSPYVIDEELTPTLYRLSTNGFVFNNFYCSFPNTTTNGEYAFCMGLLPDMSRTKSASSFDASCGNYLPYCMGNVFTALGADAYAYHNYYGTFYDRDVIHANMGYDFSAVGSGLDIPVGWPSSDLDMINASVDDFLQDDGQFHVYYMTFSGHYQYDWGNDMSAKNRAAVEDLPYSDTVKAYLACNLELEYALQALTEQLEQAGVEYDSRLLAGKDVLADCTHVAVLSDQSYLTDTFCYDAASGNAASYDGTPVDAQTVQDYCDYVGKLFAVSTEILQTDYYAHVFDGHALVDPNGSMGFTDIDNIFLKSGVLFVTQNGYMEPDTPTVFGATRQAELGELINALYQMEGAPAVPEDTAIDRNMPYREAAIWAQRLGLISNAAQMSKELTIEQAAVTLCRYARLLRGTEIIMDSTALSDVRAEYPNLSEESVIALNWCHQFGIINGMYDGPLYASSSSLVNRGQLAAYLQRFYFKVN